MNKYFRFGVVSFYFIIDRIIQLDDPHREPTNLYNWGKEAWKKFRASTGFEAVPSANTGAMLYQLSYEARAMRPHILEPGHFCGFYLSHEGNRWKNKLNYFSRRREASNCTILTVSPPIYTTGKRSLKKMTWLPMYGFIAQLAEHRTGIRGGHGFKSLKFWIFFRPFFSPIA